MTERVSVGETPKATAADEPPGLSVREILLIRGHNQHGHIRPIHDCPKCKNPTCRPNT